MHPFHLHGVEPSLAFAHLPAEPSGRGVLLVPPHGWDDQTSYRPRFRWAEALAADGVVALRLDLPGSGDSAGGVRDPGRVEAWASAIAAGVAWLREDGGADRVAVVAMGLGGLLALRAMADGLAVDDLVLWGTPAKGRSVVRELKAFGRLEASQTGEDVSAIPEGEVRAGGHVMTAETAEAVGRLTAGELLGGVLPDRALLAGRDGIDPDAALVDGLGAAGVDVRVAPGRGWGAALSGVHSARPPQELMATTAAFLAEVPVGAGRAPVAPPQGVATRIGDVRETPLRWPGGDGWLFGVLTEPAVGSVRVTAMLLNSGAIRHIGPNRMWTETARRWAAGGVATLRLDLEGMGDSDGDETPYEDVDGYHREHLQRQVGDALDMLAARGLPDRFLLAGVCSGAYWAFHAALDDARVRWAVCINQRAFFWDPDAEPSRELRRFLRIFTRRGFRNMLVGDRRLLRLWRLARWLLAQPYRRLAHRGAARSAPEDELETAVALLRDRGQRVDLAFCDDERLHDWLVAEDRVPALVAAGVHVHDLPLNSHTLKPLPAQVAASALLDRAMQHALDVAGGPDAPGTVEVDGRSAEVTV